MCFTDQIHTAKQNVIGRNVVLMQQKKNAQRNAEHSKYLF